MNKFGEYIERKKKQAEEFLERTKKNIQIADRMSKNKEYDERVGETGGRLYTWNIEGGGWIHPKNLQNPKVTKRPRYTQDPVYQKLAGVRQSKGKIRRRGGITQMDFLYLADSVIRGLTGKIENRKMTEEEYTRLLEMPRSEVYNEILNETHKIYQEALKKAGYDAEKYKYSFGNDEKFEKLREARRMAARNLEKRFNVDLSNDFPHTSIEKKYTLEELKDMHPVFARRLVLLGKVKLE